MGSSWSHIIVIAASQADASLGVAVALALLGRPSVDGRRVRGTLIRLTGCRLGSGGVGGLVENVPQRTRVSFFIGVWRGRIAGVDDAHHDRATRMSASVLRKVVAPRELLTALVALERLVLSVEGAVVTLEVLLATEATGAESAHKGLGGIVRQGLLTTTSVNRNGGSRSLRSARMRVGVVAGLDSLGCRGVCLRAGGTAVDRRLRLLAN